MVFDGDAPHKAEPINCSWVGCARLILSFSGDNAVFDADRISSMLPVALNQTQDGPLQSPAFPLVFAEDLLEGEELEERYGPQFPLLRPTYGDVLHSLIQGVVAGIHGFRDLELARVKKMMSRVASAAVSNTWAVPVMDLQTGRSAGHEIITLPLFQSLGSWAYSLLPESHDYT